jgi:hypothetical protein
MIYDLPRGVEKVGHECAVGRWRMLISAWIVALVFMLLFAGVQATACYRNGSQSPTRIAGAAIPQHDPCVRPGIPSAANVDGCKTTALGGDRFGYW